jgi:hypothetical protein
MVKGCDLDTRLTAGSLRGRGTQGYSARSRVHVEGVTMDELDAAVIEAGGRVEARQLRPRLLPGRHGPRITDTFWYVIPETALTATDRVL